MWPFSAVAWQAELERVVEAIVDRHIHIPLAAFAIWRGLAGSVLWPTLFSMPLAWLLWRDFQAERRQCRACIREVDGLEIPIAEMRHRRAVLESKLAAVESRLAATEAGKAVLEEELRRTSRESESPESGGAAAPSESSTEGKATRGVLRTFRPTSRLALQQVDIRQLQHACEALVVCLQWANGGRPVTRHDAKPHMPAAEETQQTCSAHDHEDEEETEDGRKAVKASDDEQMWRSTLTDVVAQEATIGPLFDMRRTGSPSPSLPKSGMETPSGSPSIAPRFCLEDAHAESPGARANASMEEFDAEALGLAESPAPRRSSTPDGLNLPAIAAVEGATSPQRSPPVAIRVPPVAISTEIDLDHEPAPGSGSECPDRDLVAAGGDSPSLSSAAVDGEDRVALRTGEWKSQIRGPRLLIEDTEGMKPRARAGSADAELGARSLMIQGVWRGDQGAISGPEGDPEEARPRSMTAMGEKALASVMESLPTWGGNMQDTVQTGLESFKGAITRNFSHGN